MTTPLSLQNLSRHIQTLLAQNGFEILDVKPIGYGMQFRIGRGAFTGIFRIYQNKKGAVKYDYSQLHPESLATAVIAVVEPDRCQPSYPPFPLIGADESGKGDFFGPLVCAAIAVDEALSRVLIRLGVRDSKRMTEASQLRVAEGIRDAAPGRFAVYELPPPDYNRVYGEGRARGENLNRLLAHTHALAIGQVVRATRYQRVLVDQFGPAHLLKTALASCAVELSQMHRAEQHVAVAAASILARERYVTSLQELSERVQMDLPKGASATVEKAAREFVQRYGRDQLQTVAKCHFKTAARL